MFVVIFFLSLLPSPSPTSLLLIHLSSSESRDISSHPVSPPQTVPQWSFSLHSKLKGIVAANNIAHAVRLNMKLGLIFVRKAVNGAWSYAYLRMI